MVLTLSVFQREVLGQPYCGKSSNYKFHGSLDREDAFLWEQTSIHSTCKPRIASQVMISLTSQSRLGYAKYRTRNDGRANRTVTSMYKAKMAALAGIA